MDLYGPMRFFRCATRRLALTAGLSLTIALHVQAVERPESQQEYWAQVDLQDWDAAAAAAEELVAVARKKADQNPLGLADALDLLADARLSKMDHAAALASYEEALRIVQTHTNATSSRLIEPLRGLGYSHAGAGHDAQAVPYLQRALAIIHRNHGLFDAGQRAILWQLVISLTRSGQAAEAERQIQYLLKVEEHAYGRDDPQLAPTLVRVGDWYGELGYFRIARAHYRQAIAILETTLGKADPQLVEPLQALAASHVRELLFYKLYRKADRRQPDADSLGSEARMSNPRQLSSEGEIALRRALALLERLPTPPVERLAGVLLQYGDWHQIKQQPQEALLLYRRAAAMLDRHASSMKAQSDTQAAASHTSALATMSAPLSFPVRVYYPIPPQAMRNLNLPDDQADETFVQMEFTVTRDGVVTDAEVIDCNASTRQVSEALQAIKGSRFRPRFMDGEPVETTGMTSREVFRTRKASGSNPAAAADPDSGIPSGAAGGSIESPDGPEADSGLDDRPRTTACSRNSTASLAPASRMAREVAAARGAPLDKPRAGAEP